MKDFEISGLVISLSAEEAGKTETRKKQPLSRVAGLTAKPCEAMVDWRGQEEAVAGLAAQRSRYFFPKYPTTAAQRNSDMNRDNDQFNIGSESAMRWHTSASSSSAGVVDDIFRLIPLNERAAFRETLEIEFHGRKLSDHEKRRAAERIWRSLLKYGWPT
jgi:hypothetical protein